MSGFAPAPPGRWSLRAFNQVRRENEPLFSPRAGAGDLVDSAPKSDGMVAVTRLGRSISLGNWPARQPGWSCRLAYGLDPTRRLDGLRVCGVATEPDGGVDRFYDPGDAAPGGDLAGHHCRPDWICARTVNLSRKMQPEFCGIRAFCMLCGDSKSRDVVT